MTVIKASATPTHIVLDTGDGSLSQTPLALSGSEALFLLASLQQALEALPKPDLPLELRTVSFVGSPDFAVGVLPTGETAVRFALGGLPTMEFSFSSEGVSKLRADLKRASLVARVPGRKQ